MRSAIPKSNTSTSAPHGPSYPASSRPPSLPRESLLRHPELLLNLLLDEPPKLREELSQGLTIASSMSAPGDRGASSSGRHRPSPRLAPAGLHMSEVGR